MIVRVYDDSLTTVNIIRPMSLQWTRKFADYGSFEMCMAPPAAAGIGINTIISTDKDRLCGIVKRIYSDGETVTVSGYDLKGLCLQRIDTDGYSGLAGKVITSMATKALTEGSRAIPFLTVEESEAGEETSIEAETAKLATKINDVCAQSELGYEIEKSGSSFVFRVTAGRDKSGELLFATRRKNIAAAEYDDNRLTGGATFVYNVTASDGETVITEYDTGAEGIDRVETYTTASGSDEEITVEMEKAITDAQTQATASAVIKPDGYLTEFDLGDYVTIAPCVIGNEEIIAVKQITQIKEVYEYGKTKITTTFGTKYKSMIRRLVEL